MENAHGLILRGKENDLKLNIGDDLAQDLYRIENCLGISQRCFSMGRGIIDDHSFLLYILLFNFCRLFFSSVSIHYFFI